MEKLRKNQRKQEHFITFYYSFYAKFGPAPLIFIALSNFVVFSTSENSSEGNFWIRIEKNSWIQIRSHKIWMRIHSPASNSSAYSIYLPLHLTPVLHLAQHQPFQKTILHQTLSKVVYSFTQWALLALRKLCWRYRRLKKPQGRWPVFALSLIRFSLFRSKSLI